MLLRKQINVQGDYGVRHKPHNLLKKVYRGRHAMRVWNNN